MSGIILETGGLLLLEDSDGGGGGGETAAYMSVLDNQDGTGATATISGGDADATYTVYVARLGTKNWVSAGSRTGNGDISLDLSIGDYIGQVVGESSIGQLEHFWVSSGSVFRNRTRDRNALSILRTISGGGTSRSKGVQVVFSAPGEDPVMVWALEDGDYNQTTSLMAGVATNEGYFKLQIPRQSGFPPTEWKFGTQLTYNGTVYQVMEVDGNIDLSAVFILTCGRHMDTAEY